ncbi:MAG: extracellular solute-binding protein [Promicromonosporaceae bacterium]|nr:extracellular solute-binding protein [Promicromonosporaceae bacterium]
MFQKSLKKTAATLVGIALLATGLSACGGDDAPSSITAVVLSGASYDGCFADIAAAFEDEHGVEVEVLNVGFAMLRDQLLTSMAGGTNEFDVIMIAYQWTGEFAQFVVPLNDRVAAGPQTGIVPGILGMYQFEDDQVAVPLIAQAETLFYRADLLEAAGFAVPTTWDEFDAINEFFTNNPDFPGVHGTSVKAAEGHLVTAFNNRYFGLGGGALGEPGSTFDVDIATAALEHLQRTVNFSPSGALQAAFPEVSAQFTDGRVVMTEMMPNTMVPHVLSQDDSNTVRGLVGTAPIPGGRAEAGGWGLAIPDTSANSDLAWEFINMVTSPDWDLHCFNLYGKTGIYASSYEALDGPIADFIPGVLAATEGSMPRPRGADAGEISTMMTDVIARLLAGQISDARAAAEEMGRLYDEITS